VNDGAVIRSYPIGTAKSMTSIHQLLPQLVILGHAVESFSESGAPLETSFHLKPSHFLAFKPLGHAAPCRNLALNPMSYNLAQATYSYMF
jgi:hypothetical protein